MKSPAWNHAGLIFLWKNEKILTNVFFGVVVESGGGEK